MSTQTVEHIQSIEHLDHTPMCEGRAHRGPAAPADFYIDQHGCANYLLCAACVRDDHERLGHLDDCCCDECGRTGRLYDLITVVPL